MTYLSKFKGITGRSFWISGRNCLKSDRLLDQRHSREEFFRTSGDKIRFFLEEGALAPDGSLTCDKYQAFNKVGHALHDLDPVFSAFSRKPALAELAATLGLVDPLLLQSMYIFKSAHIGAEVVCHQDSTFLYTEPESVLGFWVALGDATVENGCLWAAPGGHKGPLRQRFHHRDGKLGMTTLDSTPFEEASIPLEAKQGSLIVLHGRLPHRSGANLSDRSRHAYTLHVIDGFCSYPDDNWLHRSADMPLRGFVKEPGAG
ncbi:MAG: phytanoyl-CoA dioxygenase family protein [Endozoicomonas sp.]